MAQHPGRTHLVLGGTTGGLINVWDTRQGKGPLTCISKHSSAVLDVKFHQHRPLAVSCGDDGQISSFQGNWDNKPSVKEVDLSPSAITLSVKSVDLCEDILAAGGDNGILVLMRVD